MKITDIKAIPLCLRLKETPPLSVPRLRGGDYVQGGTGPSNQHVVLVKVFTDEGITGYGEVFRSAPGAVSTFVEEALKPLLVGEDPMHVERLWNLMYRARFSYGRKGLSLHCISGVEIGLWDIIGKYRNIPIYEMLGGAQHKIKAYASLPQYQEAKDVATIALRCVDEGYTAVKIHVHNMADSVESVVKVVRKAIGDDTILMVDVNGAWPARQAVERIKRLEQYNIFWIEEPVQPRDDYDGMEHVRCRSSIPIAAGENEYTRYGFREMLSRGAVDVVQPDITKAGGISECRKILALAESWNLQLIPHSPYYGPGFAATLHFILSNVGSDFAETRFLPLEASLIQPCLRPEKGFITLPDGPGLGIDIDEDVVKSYPYIH